VTTNVTDTERARKESYVRTSVLAAAPLYDGKKAKASTPPRRPADLYRQGPPRH
jgi:hypothetical protein